MYPDDVTPYRYLIIKFTSPLPAHPIPANLRAFLVEFPPLIERSEKKGLKFSCRMLGSSREHRCRLFSHGQLKKCMILNRTEFAKIAEEKPIQASEVPQEPTLDEECAENEPHTPIERSREWLVFGAIAQDIQLFSQEKMEEYEFSVEKVEYFERRPSKITALLNGIKRRFSSAQ